MNAHSAPRFIPGARPLKMIKPINAAWVACVANAIILVLLSLHAVRRKRKNAK